LFLFAPAANIARMERNGVSRRDVLRAGGVVALVVVGCKSNRTLPTCTDTTGLTPDEIKVRETLAYNDRSPDPNKACERCVQYGAGPSAESCANCKVLKGPISPAGTCKVFAPKT
jgi:hypothetical protein